MEQASNWQDMVYMILATVGTGIVGLIFLAIRMCLKKLFGKMGASEAEQAAIMALTEGVEKTAEEYVLELKRSQVNGRLTIEQRTLARDKAIAHAKEVVKSEGIEVLKTISKERAGHLIKLIINKVAKPKTEVKK